jgi:hypothetical protein
MNAKDLDAAVYLNYLRGCQHDPEVIVTYNRNVFLRCDVCKTSDFYTVENKEDLRGEEA